MIPVPEIFGEGLPLGSALISLASLLVVSYASRCSAESEREDGERISRETRAARLHRMAHSREMRPSP